MTLHGVLLVVMSGLLTLATIMLDKLQKPVRRIVGP